MNITQAGAYDIFYFQEIDISTLSPTLHIDALSVQKTYYALINNNTHLREKIKVSEEDFIDKIKSLFSHESNHLFKEIMPIIKSKVKGFDEQVRRGISDKEAEIIWSINDKFARDIGIKRIKNIKSGEYDYVGFGYMHAYLKHANEFVNFGGFDITLKKALDETGIFILSQDKLLTIYPKPNPDNSKETVFINLITTPAGELITFYIARAVSNIREKSVLKTFEDLAKNLTLPVYFSEDKNTIYIRIYEGYDKTIFISYHKIENGWDIKEFKLDNAKLKNFYRLHDKIEQKKTIRKAFDSIKSDIRAGCDLNIDLADLNMHTELKRMKEVIGKLKIDAKADGWLEKQIEIFNAWHQEQMNAYHRKAKKIHRRERMMHKIQENSLKGLMDDQGIYAGAEDLDISANSDYLIIDDAITHDTIYDLVFDREIYTNYAVDFHRQFGMPLDNFVLLFVLGWKAKDKMKALRLLQQLTNGLYSNAQQLPRLIEFLNDVSLDINVFTARYPLLREFVGIENVYLFIPYFKKLFGVDEKGRLLMKTADYINFLKSIPSEKLPLLTSILHNESHGEDLIDSRPWIPIYLDAFTVTLEFVAGKNTLKDSIMIDNPSFHNLNNNAKVEEKFTAIWQKLNEKQRSLLKKRLEIIIGDDNLYLSEFPNINFEIFADEVSQVLYEYGKELAKRYKTDQDILDYINRNIDELHFLKGKGIEFKLLSRTFEELKLGEITGDCTSPSGEWFDRYVSDWFPSSHFQIMQVFYNGKLVMKLHLLDGGEILLIDAHEAIPQMTEHTESTSSTLVKVREGIMNTTRNEVLKFAKDRGFKKVFANAISNSTWIVEYYNRLLGDHDLELNPEEYKYLFKGKGFPFSQSQNAGTSLRLIELSPIKSAEWQEDFKTGIIKKVDKSFLKQFAASNNPAKFFEIFIEWADKTMADSEMSKIKECLEVLFSKSDELKKIDFAEIEKLHGNLVDDFFDKVTFIFQEFADRKSRSDNIYSKDFALFLLALTNLKKGYFPSKIMRTIWNAFNDSLTDSRDKIFDAILSKALSLESDDLYLVSEIWVFLFTLANSPHADLKIFPNDKIVPSFSYINKLDLFMHKENYDLLEKLKNGAYNLGENSIKALLLIHVAAHSKALYDNSLISYYPHLWSLSFYDELDMFLEDFETEEIIKILKKLKETGLINLYYDASNNLITLIPTWLKKKNGRYIKIPIPLDIDLNLILLLSEPKQALQALNDYFENKPYVSYVSIGKILKLLADKRNVFGQFRDFPAMAINIFAHFVGNIPENIPENTIIYFLKTTEKLGLFKAEKISALIKAINEKIYNWDGQDLNKIFTIHLLAHLLTANKNGRIPRKNGQVMDAFDLVTFKNENAYHDFWAICEDLKQDGIVGLEYDDENNLTAVIPTWLVPASGDIIKIPVLRAYKNISAGNNAEDAVCEKRQLDSLYGSTRESI